MDFGKAFTFIRDDEKWLTKIGIGTLLMLGSSLLLGIPIFLVLGYRVATTRNVMNGEKNPLPEWTDFGRLFMDGLNIAIGTVVYASPAILLMCVGWGFTVFPVFLSGGDEDAAAALMGLGFAIYFVLFCLAMLVSLAVALVGPAIHIQYARTGQLGSLFRFGEIIGMVRANLANILLIFVAYIAATFVLQLVVSISFITICGPFILIFLGSLWLQLSVAHLYGQMGAMSEGKGLV